MLSNSFAMIDLRQAGSTIVVSASRGIPRLALFLPHRSLEAQSPKKNLPDSFVICHAAGLYLL
jgi:hypothetical protein